MLVAVALGTPVDLFNYNPFTRSGGRPGVGGRVDFGGAPGHGHLGASATASLHTATGVTTKVI